MMWTLLDSRFFMAVFTGIYLLCRDAFKRFGEIRDVYLPRDYNTQKPKGFGFVEFFDERDAEDAAREMDRREIDGNEISVVQAQNRRKSVNIRILTPFSILRCFAQLTPVLCNSVLSVDLEIEKC
jgi:RNA recognition motif-containing protein